jgi:hypothetical protein
MWGDGVAASKIDWHPENGRTRVERIVDGDNFGECRIETGSDMRSENRIKGIPRRVIKIGKISINHLCLKLDRARPLE